MLLDEHLNEKPGVSDKLKNKIIDVANDMGYVPNVMAREIMWQGTWQGTRYHVARYQVPNKSCQHLYPCGLWHFCLWYLVP